MYYMNKPTANFGLGKNLATGAAITGGAGLLGITGYNFYKGATTPHTPEEQAQIKKWGKIADESLDGVGFKTFPSDHPFVVEGNKANEAFQARAERANYIGAPVMAGAAGLVGAGLLGRALLK